MTFTGHYDCKMALWSLDDECSNISSIENKKFQTASYFTASKNDDDILTGFTLRSTQQTFSDTFELTELSEEI